MVLERVEAAGQLGAVGLEPLVERAKRLDAQAVQPALGVAADLDEAGVPQHLEVAGDAGLVHADGVDELGHRTLAAPNGVEDPPPCRFGDRIEHREVAGHEPNIHQRVYMGQRIYWAPAAGAGTARPGSDLGGTLPPMAVVLLPVPDRDFDTTEVAVPWRLLTDAGHTVVFATERGGKAPETDPLLLSGVVFKMLGAAREAKQFYADLLEDERFNNPIGWSDVRPADYDGLLLPGGHAKGMRQYLDSAVLQAKVVEYWATGKPVGAICHGVLVLARAIDPRTGRSVLHGRRTTCLPRSLEMSGYFSTFWRRGRYYRTYPAYVQREVQRALASRRDFSRGAPTFLIRGTRARDRTAFVVEDGNYVSARWPGDAYLFARRLEALLAKHGDFSGS